MKRKFTKLLAALALLLFLAPSLAGWGQVSWERVTSISTLTGGGTFIMGYEATAKSGVIIPLRSKDCNATTSANGYFNTGTTDGSSTNGTIDMSDLSGVTTSDYEVYITGRTVNSNSNYINIQRTNSSGNFYGATSGGNSSNKGRLYTSGNSNETNLLLEWASETNNQFKLTANVSGQYKYLKYNTGSPRYAFYNSAGEKIVFYKKVVSGSTVATPTFTPAAGTYFEAQDVEIACETSGATLQYKLTENGAWQTYTSAIHVTETTTIWAKATLGEETSEATATYTIPTLITMAAAHELENNAYGYVQGVVTFIDGRNVYAQDGTGGICLFLNDGTVPDGLAIGDKVRAYGQKTVYNGLIELKNIDGNSSAFTTVSTGNVLPLAVKTISEILTGASDELQSTRVKIENAVIGEINTSGNTSLTQESNTINIYKVPALTGIQATDYVNVIGVIGYYNAAQVRVASADDVEKVVISTPTITVSTNTLNNFTYVAGSGPSDAQSFTVSGSNLSADITISLGNNSNFEISTSENSGYDSSLTLNQSEGTVSATLVYVRMKSDLSTGDYDDDIEITSGSVTPETINLSGTVTAPSAPHVTWDLSTDQTVTATVDEMTWTSVYATMRVDKGNATTNTNNYYPGTSGQNYTSTRFYKNSILTIAPVFGYSITSVVFTATTNSYAKALKNSSWTNASATMEDETNGTTVTVTPTTGNSDIRATIGGTCGLTEVKVYYETFTVAPVWSTLPTPAINTNSNYLLDLSDYVTGSPTPTITLTSTTATSGYVFDADILDFTPTANGTYTFTFTATNSEGSAQATLTITVITVHDVVFYVNNEEGGERQVGHGEAIGDLPVPTANIPTGFTFVGWMESLPQSDPYYNATTAPTLVEATDLVYGDMILEAVFCIGETVQGTYQLSNAVPADEEQVVLAVNNGGTYYAMNGPVVEQLSVSNNTINGTPDAVFVAEAVGNCIALKQGNQYIHLNSGAIKIANEQTNGLLDFTQSGTGYLVSTTVTVNEVEVTRYIKYDTDNDKFTVTTDQSEASTLYIFKYIPGTTTNKDYTTLVVYHADQTYIAEDNPESLYGIHYINGEVGALHNVTNSGKIVVKDGGVLDMSIVTFSNNTAANLVIEDGAQLKIDNAVHATVKKNITGYGEANANTNKGYYLISAPAERYLFVASGNTDVDAYRFDASKQGEEWRNFKLADGAWHISAGNAILYASKNDCTLSLDGYGIVYNTPNPGANEVYNKVPATTSTIDVDVALNSGKTFQGWNLIGNPYTCTAYLANGTQDFYRMNSTGDAIVLAASTERAIDVCEGIFVHCNASGTVTFTTTEPTPDGANASNNGMVNISVAQVVNSRDAQPSADYARIRINNGENMSKFVFNENTSRVYIPRNGKDYAVVRSEARGEMPVNFKAAEAGTYTISVEAENLDVNYLHLIDNMTGMDIDLLATPSYTFEGKKSDYASRFKLVFSANAGNNEVDEDFAFVSDGNIIILNEGEATLQVIDIMGRVISTQTVNGNASVNNVGAAGVYVLQLINGNNVKTQKIVVR